MDQSEQPNEACCPHLHAEKPWVNHSLPLVWFQEDKNFNWLQLQLLEQIFQPIIRSELQETGTMSVNIQQSENAVTPWLLLKERSRQLGTPMSWLVGVHT